MTTQHNFVFRFVIEEISGFLTKRHTLLRTFAGSFWDFPAPRSAARLLRTRRNTSLPAALLGSGLGLSALARWPGCSRAIARARCPRSHCRSSQVQAVSKIGVPHWNKEIIAKVAKSGQVAAVASCFSRCFHEAALRKFRYENFVMGIARRNGFWYHTLHEK